MPAQGLLALVNLVQNLGLEADHVEEYDGFWSRLIWASSTVFNPQGIGRPWGIRIVPCPGDVNKARFVLVRLMQGVMFLVLAVVDEELRAKLLPLHLDGSPPSHLMLECVLDTYAGLKSLYLSWSACHCIVSAVAVGFFGADPLQWPPLFGSPYSAYTLRRFWG